MFIDPRNDGDTYCTCTSESQSQWVGGGAALAGWRQVMRSIDSAQPVQTPIAHTCLGLHITLLLATTAAAAIALTSVAFAALLYCPPLLLVLCCVSVKLEL